MGEKVGRGRPLAQVALIVVGVLLAFAVESRWETFQQQRQSTAYFAGVAQELKLNRDYIESRLNSERRRGRAADSLVAISYDSISASAATISHLLWQTTTAEGFSTETVALEGLLRAPTWTEIEDPILQRALATLEVTLARLEEDARDKADYWFESYDPYLRSRIDYVAWAENLPSPGVDWTALLKDREFRNLIVHGQWFSESFVPRYERALAELELLLQRLEEFLAN